MKRTIALALAVLGLLLIITGCGKQTTKKTVPKLTGIYQIDAKYRDKDNDGNVQTDYLRLTKDGKVQEVEPETGGANHGEYGSVMRGTCRHLSGQKFQLKLHDVYDKNYYTVTAIKEDKNHFRTLDNHHGEYEWDADSWTRETTMTASDFQSMFERAAMSDQKKIQENGYTKPDNDSTNSNSAGADSSNSSEMTFDQAAALIQKGGFSDFNYDSAKDFHDGSHATSDGGYVMVTYPGAKGQDKFTITKKGDHKYHIEAVYGTLDGGNFTAFDDQSSYGPTSADVTE